MSRQHGRGTRLRSVATAGVGLACSLVAAGCGAPAGVAGASPSAVTAPARSATAAGAAGSPPAVTSQPRRVSKILVVMEENHSIGQVFPSHMPHLWALALAYGRATAWSDVSHPSLPNYLAIFAGSIFDDPADCSPGPGCQYAGHTVFGQALARGLTARAYEESMPSPCSTSSSGEYDVNHNPWAYFPDEASQCAAGDVPAGTATAGALASDLRDGTLPNVAMVTPNLMHDGHDGTLAEADSWLAPWMQSILAGPDWVSGRLAVVVVFDEGETTETVPFVILAPGLSGAVVTKALDHYSLTLLIDEVAGAAPLRDAVGRPSLVPLLGLKL